MRYMFPNEMEGSLSSTSTTHTAIAIRVSEYLNGFIQPSILSASRMRYVATTVDVRRRKFNIITLVDGKNLPFFFISLFKRGRTQR